MKSSLLFTKIYLVVFYGLLTVGLSCVDHDITPVNLPESACLATDGSPRTYPCEFVIEKLTFLGKAGTVVGEATKADIGVVLSRTNAKSDSNPGASMVGDAGAAKYDVKMRLKRVASPSFPVTLGYLVSASSNPARQNILHTPGERFNIGSPVALDVPIGETRDVMFEVNVIYTFQNVGGVVRPVDTGSNIKVFFIENDNTTLKFNRSVDPYRFVGSVVEDYIRLNLTPTL